MRAINHRIWMGFLVLVLVAACGREEGREPQNTGDEDLARVTDISQIMGSGAEEFVGHPVTLEGQVQDVPGDYLFWIGGRAGAVPVVLEGEMYQEAGEAQVQIRRGRQVRVTGTVRSLSTVSENDPMWRLIDEEERREIEGARVYIGAREVSELGSDGALSTIWRAAPAE